MSTPLSDFESLRDGLRNANKRVRLKAAMGLSKLGDSRSVEPLVTALDDPSERVRYWAVLALGRLNDPRAIEPLVRRLADDDGRVRTAAAAAVKKFGKAAYAPLLAAYRSGAGKLRFSALAPLGKFKTAEVSELLIAALDDPDQNMRWEAARVLGVRKDRRAVEALIAKLDEGGIGTIVYVRALGQIGDPRAFAPLKELLVSSRFEPCGVHREVVTALRQINNPAAVDFLHEQLEDPANPDRHQLAHGLAGMDLMNATQSFARNARGDVGKLLQGFAATKAALGVLKARRQSGQVPVSTEEGGITKASTDMLRNLESIIRDLDKNR